VSKFFLYADASRERIKSNAVAFIDRLPANKPFVLTIEPLKRERSDSQNRGLFGVAYPPLMDFCGLQGDEDKRQLHREFCGEFFGWRDDLPMNMRKPIRTTTTNERGQRDVVPWDVFCAFYGFVQRKGAELGVFIPDPDPLWREVKREARKAA
jgi:hypothetical protein